MQSHDEKVSSSERRQMIAEAAYFRAEQRGFAPGDTVRDWCEAEAEVDARLAGVQDDELIVKVDELLALAAKKLVALRRKVARLSAAGRGEWQRDLDRLAALRDALRPKLAELKKQGERTGKVLREQTERIRGELADLVQRLDARGRS